MKSIKKEIEINAKVKTVWKVFTDFEKHSDWNPFIIHIKGKPEENAQLEIKVQSPEGRSTTFKTKVKTVEENAKLCWTGHAGFKSMLEAEHCFEFKALDEQTTLFTQHETFEGLLTAMMDKELKATEAGFEEMNEALKEHCESLEENR